VGTERGGGGGGDGGIGRGGATTRMRMTWRSAVCVGTRNLSNGQTNFSERKKGRSAGGAVVKVCPFWMGLLEGKRGGKSPSQSESDMVVG